MDKVFLELLNLSIAASWLILAVLLLRLLLKKAPKSIICALWLLVGLRLVLPFSVESVLSLVPSRETVSPEIVHGGLLPPVTPGNSPSADGIPSVSQAGAAVIDSGLPAVDRALNPVISQALSPTVGASVDPLQVLAALGGWLWLLGMLGILGYGIFTYLRLRRNVRETVLVEKGVRQGGSVASPFVMGIFHPCIYLPGTLSEEDLPMVLAHERAHVRRRDNWVKPLGFLLLSVYWFNPLVWISYALLCRDIEAACDEHVMRRLGSGAKKRYSMALLNCSYTHRSISACPLAFGELSVKSRIKSVLNYKKPSFWISTVAILACVVLAVCFLTDPVQEPVPPAAEPVPSGAAAQITPGPVRPQELESQPETKAVLNDEFVFLIPKDGQGADYTPAKLGEIENRTVDARIVSELERMLADCRAAGHAVAIFRAYESYEDSLRQLETEDPANMTEAEYWDWLRSKTKLELQSGLSVLLARYENGENYASSPITEEEQFQADLAAWDEAIGWLEENAPDYGFVLRYPKEKIEFTGRAWKSMFRYVGEDMARYLTENNLCIEEYLLESAQA